MLPAGNPQFLFMPLTRAQKEKIVTQAAEQLQEARIAILADYRGISVAKIQAIRRALKAQGTIFGVVKKTLLKIALTKAGFDKEPLESIKEAVALTTSVSEDVTVAKALAKAAKENPELKIIGAFFESKFIGRSEVLELAKLGSREELLGRLVGTLAAPMSGLVRVLNGSLVGFTTIINKLATR